MDFGITKVAPEQEVASFPLVTVSRKQRSNNRGEGDRRRPSVCCSLWTAASRDQTVVPQRPLWFYDMPSAFMGLIFKPIQQVRGNVTGVVSMWYLVAMETEIIHIKQTGISIRSGSNWFY